MRMRLEGVKKGLRELQLPPGGSHSHSHRASAQYIYGLGDRPSKTVNPGQVNVAGEEGKGGIEPAELGDFIGRCPVRVTGLMTMPPFSEDPEDSRPHFARLAELAAEHGLGRLSMGTSQDWEVAVEEGATIIRLGTALYVLKSAPRGHNR